MAVQLGLSENRLYSDLIQEGLLIREQMAYFSKLRAMQVPTAEGLTLLERAPDASPEPGDELPRNKPPRQTKSRTR